MQTTHDYSKHIWLARLPADSLSANMPSYLESLANGRPCFRGALLQYHKHTTKQGPGPPYDAFHRLRQRLGGWGLQALPANDEDKDSDYYDCDDVDSAGGGRRVIWIYITFMIQLG